MESMRHVIIAGALSFGGGLVLQRLLIALQLRLHWTQVQKSYGVGVDLEAKASIPTFGGVAFILTALCAALFDAPLHDMGIHNMNGGNYNAAAWFFWSLPVASGVIGLIDDGLKSLRKSSEGLTSLRKLGVQLAVAAAWTLWARSRGPLVFAPGLALSDWFMIPATVLAAAGMMNAVNITDGLDGLAGGAFLISLGILACLPPFNPGRGSVEFAVSLGMAASFLFYNLHPARIFMGDTGSHFLGGVLVVLCVTGGGMALLIPAGFLFWIELLSSAVQIVSIRKFGRKIFRMAPLHHHFQRMGWDETTVTTRFLLIHAIGAALSAALCVSLWGA